MHFCQVRRAIGDFGVPISIVVMAVIAFLIPYTHIQVRLYMCISVILHCYFFAFMISYILIVSF